MNVWKLTILTSLNMFLVACGGSGAIKSGDSNNAKSDPPAASATRDSKTSELFVTHCGNCHQPNGEGGTVKVEDTKLKVPSLKSGRVLKHSDQDYSDQILKGGDGMPAFKDKLKQEEINDLVRFIREQIQGNVTAR